MVDAKYLHSDLTDKIIDHFFKVYNKLGYGFLEKVYENAMIIELRKNGFHVESQKKISVYYEGESVGEYYADLIVDGLVIIELKAADCLCSEHANQLLNYLRATDIEVGLLLNFGKEAGIKRKTFFNSDKRSGKS
jgi:GxxExxY protein